MSAARADENRPFDVIVFGATGFTGGKTAEYLAKNAPATLRWAIAGRSAPKLEAVRARLVALAPSCKVGVVEASVDEPASLSRMAAQTRVVLTTVGPFIDYGEPLVQACIDAGTDYVDSTGEPFFVERLLVRHGDAAARAGVRIVSSCGFDSIPADLGALFTVKHLPEGVPIHVSGYMKLKGTFSGGTERSAIKSLAPPPGAVKPTPPNPAGRRVRLVPEKPRRRPDLGGWSSPLPTLDGPVVVRSAASIGRYGPDFSYSHNVIHPSFLVMWVAFWVFGGLALVVRVPFIKNALLSIVKKSGQGPTDAQMAAGWFKLRFVAEGGGKKLQTEVAGGDPGYGETSKMLAESALCLALDRDALPPRAGILTPAEAMGELLLARLQRAGLAFTVLEG
ncbi:MAG TPA: saccharopine dehydrogenase NADP-binding domain-containing protein [Polyangiaceae bacterium]|jgi:saccharopine dehydrogenase (NAD+, L-glutamate forming)|nr:saccharopine dehydrogenase NADP-binding domain-containing protein [Polyangiaceae bacterium]